MPEDALKDKHHDSSEDSKPKSYAFLPFLFFIIFFLLCSSAFLAYQNMGLRSEVERLTPLVSVTPSPIVKPHLDTGNVKNWRVYSDIEGEFDISYPPGWTAVPGQINIDELQSDDQLAQVDVTFTENGYTQGDSASYGKLGIVILGITNETDIEEWFKGFTKTASLSFPASALPQKEAIVFGTDGTKILKTAAVSNSQKYFFIKNGLVFGINTSYPLEDYEGKSENYQVLNDTYNNMLNSITSSETSTP